MLRSHTLVDPALPGRCRLRSRDEAVPGFAGSAQQHVSEMHKRHLIFSALLIGSIAVFAAPIRDLVRLSLGDERYSHLLLIPPLAALLLCLKGRTAFQTPNYSPRVGATVLGLGAGLSILAWLAPTRPGTTWLAQDVHLSAQTSALLVIWMAAFLLCYGARAFRQAIFPLLFLFLVVPLPTVVVDKAVIALQHGSAAVTYGLFKLMQIPVLAQGVRLSLPGVDIEIAQECSGIRSSESLVITSILAGYFLLHSAWTRTWLIALTVPIAILKNAIRIATISGLGIYVNPAFLHGNLHRYGGLPFSLVALSMLLLVLWLLRQWEAWGKENQARAGALS